VHTLLAGASKNDVAFLVEQLPDSALLVKLETTIANPLELRLLVKDLSAHAPGLLAVENLYAADAPPTKAELYDAVAVKTARGLRTNAGASIATATMSSLTGTKEQAGAQATVDHVRGGEKPTLTHPGGAKFGDDFDNSAGRLPGVAGAGGYKEYYVEKDPADMDYHGSRRIVVSNATSHIYYTSNHYASFVRLLV
jgi:guanyl-specific ribonuclease Sa